MPFSPADGTAGSSAGSIVERLKADAHGVKEAERFALGVVRFVAGRASIKVGKEAGQMRKAKRQGSRAAGVSRPQRAFADSINGVRYTPLWARYVGGKDGRSGMPCWREGPGGEVMEQRSFYEDQNNEWHRRKIGAVEAETAAERNRLETTKRILERALAPILARLPAAEKEYEEAAADWQRDLEKYGFNAWTRGLVVLLAVFFLVEIPLNAMAFSLAGDGRLLSFSAVLGLSMTVPFAAHTIGKRFKTPGAHSKLFASAFLALLVLLLTCVAVFRLEAFRELAGSHASLANTSTSAVAAFYLALQLTFSVFAIEKSFSLTNPMDEAEKAHLKFARARHKHADRDLTRLRRAAARIEQSIEGIEGALKGSEEQRAIEVAQIDSHRLEVRSVYRRNVALKRQVKATIPPSWVEWPTTMGAFIRPPVASEAALELSLPEESPAAAGSNPLASAGGE